MGDESKNAGINDPSDPFSSTSKVYRKSTISEESCVKNPKKTSGPSYKCISLTFGIILVGIIVAIVSAIYNQSKVIPPPSKNQKQQTGNSIS